jgi:hypothetical protein
MPLRRRRQAQQDKGDETTDQSYAHINVFAKFQKKAPELGIIN